MTPATVAAFGGVDQARRALMRAAFPNAECWTWIKPDPEAERRAAIQTYRAREITIHELTRRLFNLGFRGERLRPT